MNSLGFLETLWQDLRYGARLLRRNPTFAVVAILTLALGTGANTAIFQLVDAVRLRTLPVERPDQLVEVRILAPKGRTGSFISRRPMLSSVLWDRIRAEQRVFDGTIAWASAGWNLAPGGEVRMANGMYVSGDYFSMLGIAPAAGRVLAASDDVRGCRGAGGRPRLRVLAARIRRRPRDRRPVDHARRPPRRCRRGRRRDVHGGRSGARVRRGRPDLRRADLSRRRAQRHRPARHLVARGLRPPEAGRVDRPGDRAAQRDLAGHLRLHRSASLRGGRRQGVSAVQAVCRAGRDRRVDAPRRLQRSAEHPARRHRTGPADRLREPRQPDARARDGARTGNRRAPGDRRVAAAGRPPDALREPGDCRGSAPPAASCSRAGSAASWSRFSPAAGRRSSWTWRPGGASSPSPRP